MKRFFSLAILSSLTFSTLVHAESTNDDLICSTQSVSKIAIKAEHEREDVKQTLIADFNIDPDTIVSTFPTIDQLNKEKDRLFREGNAKLLDAVADPNKQNAFRNAMKTGIAEINKKKRIAELLEKYMAASMLLKSLTK